MWLYWADSGKQVRLRGPALALPEGDCAADFAERPLGSRSAAIASRQSEVLADPRDLEQRLTEAWTFLEDNPGHVEKGWKVYAVAPTVVEFWQGATDRNHKRLRYLLADDNERWEIDQLWP